MFKSVLVLLAAAAASSVAIAQTPSTGRWKLEAAPSGCVVHAASPSGTVVSIWGIAGQDSLSFLVQNKAWNSFADGQRYDIHISFDEKKPWPMRAVARRNIDKDGPGLTFAVSPNHAAGGASFIDQFAAAGGMNITRNGQRIETVSLDGTQVALRGLAQCLSQVWAASGSGESEAESGASVAAETI
jgi:hypothetical protein